MTLKTHRLRTVENSVLVEEADGRWRRVRGEELREVYRLVTGDYPLLSGSHILFPKPSP